MLARALRIALALELAGGIALAWWLGRDAGWGAGDIAALIAGLAAAWRIAFGLATYAVAWWFRSPTPPEHRLGPLRLLPHVLRELGAIVAVYSILQPFERFFMGDPGPPGPGARLPVLLVHGYVCNRAAAWRLARRLQARGETVWAVTIEPVYGSIDQSAQALAAAIAQLRAATGAPRVALVAHSMGGLISRAYLRDWGGAAVATLVTLGAPHHGSAHALLGLGQNAREMTPGSAWLARLAADERAFPVPFVSVFSHHDNFVAPQASAVHPRARNVALAGIGHLALLFSPRAAAALGSALDAANGGLPARHG